MLIGLFALALRAALVGWAAGRFPPVADAGFYHHLATRLSQGLGYTWQWADGVVTYVAHYPVGYPALIAGVYRVFGAEPGVAMALNAAFGAVSVLAVHRIAARGAARLGALVAALAVALHPALLFYTPALMTEGITASLLAIAAWVAVHARDARRPLRSWILLGLILGVGTLVRGQTLLVAPLFGALAAWRSRDVRRVVGGALLVTSVASLTVLPWTLRNCRRMDRCVVVSANLGWNLLIGATESATGTFVPIAGETVPEGCRQIFGEAAKDSCFTRAALGAIRQHPGRWLALVPKKLAYTFEYSGAAGWYLHAANPEAFSAERERALGVLETGFERALVLLALLGVARAPGSRRGLRLGLTVAGGLTLLSPVSWLAHVLYCLGALSLGRTLGGHPPMAVAAAATLATLATHAVFFGAGRYSLVLFPLVAAAAGLALAPRREAEAPAF